jgi:hypothetical protein
VGRVVVLASLLVAGVLGLAGGASAVAGAPRSAIVDYSLVRIHFEFRSAEFATHYTVVDTNSPLGSVDLDNATYHWELKPPADDPTCDNHGLLTGTDDEFIWDHGNVGEPGHDDGCHHDIGLPGSGHQGTVTVQIRDNAWSCTAKYTGTQAADGSPIGVGPLGLCERSAPATPPPPPPSTCKCILLTARILPSSLKIKDIHRDYAQLHLDVHWLLNCSKGRGGCHGTLTVNAPPAGYGEWHVLPNGNEDVAVGCPGQCGRLRERTKRITMFTVLDPVQRRGMRMPIKIERTCQGRKISPITLWIAFKQNGDVDLSRSKLR